jgi:hypothetical protein
MINTAIIVLFRKVLALGLFFYSHFACAQEFSLVLSDSAIQQTAYSFNFDKKGKIWIGGNKLPIGSSDLKAWLYRINDQGIIEKKITFPYEGYQTWVGFGNLSNGKLAVVLGLKTAIDLTENWLAVLDSNSIQSFRKIQGADNAILKEVSLTRSSRLLLSGFRVGPNPQGNNFWLGKLNPETANLDWVYEDGFTPIDNVQAAIECKNGDIAFCGDVQQTSINPFISRLDSNGLYIWDLAIQTQWNDGSQKLLEDYLGNFWIVGESSTAAGPSFDTQINKVSPNGILLWQQWLGSEGQDAAFIIKKAISNGFWVGGYSNASTFGNGPVSPFLMRLDQNGNSLGEHFWSFPSPSPVYDMQIKGDTSFYFCGGTNDSVFLFKRNRPGLNNVFVVSKNELKSKSSMSIYYFNINKDYLLFPQNESSTIAIYDLTGRKLLNTQVGAKYLQINGLSRGLYILTFENADGIYSKRWIK